jgi:hypothetical protein
MSEPVRDDTGMSDEPEVDDRGAGSSADAASGMSDGEASALPPPTSVESLVGALLEAGPEVADHVVRAAQELLLAAQAIVDAAEKAVREQQDLRTAREAGDDTDAGPDAGADASLHRLDLAE